MALTTIKTAAIADDAVTTDKLANAINTERTANTAKDLTALSASNLTSGTVPDARFPATLPAASAANLTAVPAANITGTLPAISATNLTSIPAANITGTLPAISGANLTGIVSAGKAHNLVINGAMQVAQRGTSSTSSGYHTVDRFSIEQNGHDEALTKEQGAVTSGGAYDSGFRNCLKITNGNQTGGAGAGDYVQIMQRIEGQNMANSGWNYLSASSYITLSFWVKSSVAQVFSGSLRSHDGTLLSFKFDTPSLSANTWTKVTKTIPGNSNLTFNNDNGAGVSVYLYPFLGTTYTSSNANTETWITAATNTYANNMTTTWWTTNDATLELTGLQLEVGDTATDFEHRSIGQELALCQRYFEIVEGEWYGPVYGTDSTIRINAPFKVTKRANPTLATISTDENCCNSVTVISNNYDLTLGARIQGNNVFLDGATRFFNAKFSASSEL